MANYRGDRIRVEGVEEFRARLADMGPEVGKALKRVHKKAATVMAERAKSAAPGRLGPAIKARSNVEGATVGTEAAGGYADAIVRFWGTKRRTGWYAAQRYRASTTQHPAWVGNQWVPGAGGGRPYIIGAALDGAVPDVEQLLLEGYLDAAKKAFPG